LIKNNEVIKYLVDNACKENANIIDDINLKNKKGNVEIPRIKNKEALLNAFNTLLTHAPAFVDDELVGLPFSALLVGIDPTLSGSLLFRLPMFNEKMSVILKDWNAFLSTAESNTGFRVEGEQWLSTKAKHQYEFPLWKKDFKELPYWKSWNSFFTREFNNANISRPIAARNSNRIAICPIDGSLFRWRCNISTNDVFWCKDMKYSLSDILSSPLKEQQDLIDEYNLVNIFKGGYIFQTYLNPYNYHRWWVPVNGEVLFTPFSIPGCFFHKLVLPDFIGATTASLPYLAQVNARGVIVFKTDNYGHVCCVPLGMSEVSTLDFDAGMKKGAAVMKGDEMGTFNYGGSSFVTIYEKIPGKELVFENENGIKYKKNPPLPMGSSGSGGQDTFIGSQIGVWETVEH